MRPVRNLGKKLGIAIGSVAALGALLHLGLARRAA